MKELAPGLAHTSTLTVGTADTAVSMGSGDLPVLATPRLAALTENAAMLAVADALADGLTTVGGYIDVTHQAPTPVGAAVQATAVLLKVEGKRLHFELTVHDDAQKIIARGSHIRFIVDRQAFLARL